MRPIQIKNILGKIELTNPDYKTVAFTKSDSEVKVLGAGKLTHQLKALKWFDNSLFNRLTQPCGSGKSLQQVAYAILDITRSKYVRKQLIVVPQVHIARGFFEKGGIVSKISIHGKIYSVAVLKEHNFCEDSSIKGLIKWLVMPSAKLAKYCNGENISGLIAMTSYHALVAAWKKMTTAQRALARNNVHYRPDESHHVAMGETGLRIDQNKVGAILKSVAEDGVNSGITTSTATDFRSDGKAIIAPALVSKFKVYRLTFIRHFKNLGIKTMGIEIMETKNNPIKRVAKIVNSERKEKHIIVVPIRVGGWRAFYKDESRGVDALIAEIRTLWKDARILNLVPQEEGRRAKKNALLDEPKRKAEIVDGEPNESKFDIVITVMIVREGTDWCPASRLHVTYVEGAIGLAVQTLGRLLRYFEGKTKIIARYYYPSFPAPDPKTGVTKSVLLDNRKNALLFMTQADDELFPIVFDEILTSKKKKTKKLQKVTLKDVMGEQAYLDMKEDFLNQAVEAGIGDQSAEYLEAIIAQVVEDHHVPERHVEHAKRTLEVVYLRRACMKYSNISINFVRERGFRQLVETLNHSQKTLVFHGHDVKSMKNLAAIVKAEFWAKMKELQKYKTLADAETMPSDLRNFAIYLKKTKAYEAAVLKG
jgi:hypothetical protein